MPAGKLGSLSAPVYFLNMRDERYPVGYYILAPYSDFPTPEGWIRYCADDWHQVGRLQRILLAQELERARREHIREHLVMEPLRKKTRDSIYSTMVSSSTSPEMRDFLRDWLKLREDKRKKHEENLYHRTLYLHAMEYDARPGRRDNEESVNLDVINL
jgi:hypothetical protein